MILLASVIFVFYWLQMLGRSWTGHRESAMKGSLQGDSMCARRWCSCAGLYPPSVPLRVRLGGGLTSLSSGQVSWRDFHLWSSTLWNATQNGPLILGTIIFVALLDKDALKRRNPLSTGVDELQPWMLGGEGVGSPPLPRGRIFLSKDKQSLKQRKRESLDAFVWTSGPALLECNSTSGLPLYQPINPPLLT